MISEDIREHHEAGNDAAQIAALLDADYRTVKPIDLGDLMFVLNNRGMLTRLVRQTDGGDKWEGTVLNMLNYVNTNPLMEPYKAGLNRWFSHITYDNNKTFDTTDATFANQLQTMASAFGGQPQMPTADDFAALVELGGGYKFAKPADTAEIQALIDDQAKLAVVEQCRESMQSELQPVLAKSTALNGWLDAMELGEMTVAEVQAYCDDLNASSDGNPSGGE